MPYEITDKYGRVLSTGTVTCDSVLQIKGDQTIHVTNIPEYINYSVKEGRKPGFTPLGGKDVFTGATSPNTTIRCDFTNIYAASGSIQLEGDKILTGKMLKRYQFKFDVYDSTGNLIRSASSAAPSETIYIEGDSGAVDHSTAPISFAAIRYTQNDVGTHVYTIVERNLSKDGYTYDDTTYTVVVNVADNGDGTLNVTRTLFKPAESGSEGKGGDEGGNGGSTP